MARERLRLALVGLGSWGTRAHLPALAARADVELVAVCDPRLDHARAVAADHGIRHVYGEPAAMFREVDGLDAAVLAVPTDRHRDVALAAIEAGVHVLCEKPLAYDLPQARELAAAVREHGRVGKLGFLFRFSPVVARMKELVDAGFIGPVRLFESLSLNGQFADPGKPRHWKMQRERANGGVFVEYGSHSLDLALWLGGPITGVVAHGLTLVPERPLEGGGRGPVDTDDACACIATFAAGGQAVCRTGWASLPVGGGGLRLYGTRGSLAWEQDPTTRRSERLLAATLDDPEPRVLLEFAPPFDPALDAGPWPLGLLARYNASLVDSFLHDVRTGRAAGPTFDDGLAVQRVLTAIRASLDHHRWADVDWSDA